MHPMFAITLKADILEVKPDFSQGCKLRIQAARAQKLVSDGSVVVAVDSFINEVVPGT